mgnify:CR=1 FL=1
MSLSSAERETSRSARITKWLVGVAAKVKASEAVTAKAIMRREAVIEDR